MDSIRTAIIIALLAVSYLIILQWNEDYPDPSQRAASAPSQQSSPGGDTALESTGLDNGADSDDLIVPSEQGESDLVVPGASEASGPVASTGTGQLISVTTDVLDLQIDPVGGRIIKAALLEYPISVNNETPLKLLQHGEGVTFLAESGLIGKDGFDTAKNGGKPNYAAEQTDYELKEGEDQLTVELKTERNGISVIKRYEFARNSYEINVSFIVDNQGTEPFTANYFAKLLRDRSADPTSSGGFGAVSYLGGVISAPELDMPYEKLDFDDVDDGVESLTSDNGWIAILQHYFVTALIPQSEQASVFQARKRNGLYMYGYVDPAFTVQPGSTETRSGKMYVGPKVLDRLDEVAPNLELTVDFGWLWLIAKPLFVVLKFLHDHIFANWGVAIILLTIGIKALFFKLSATSYRSMANMRRVTPELQRLREQHGDDRQRMSQAMMDLYKREKINPLGGCLPILVQMPVFIALYWVLLESVELRQAPFFGWIQDLSLKDPYFILPLLMGATMFLQTKLNPTPPDPMQAKVMQLMPIIFTVFFLWFPAGLVLYWFVNNLLSITQQWIITRSIEKSSTTPAKS
ncbi:membrane protein insertase YidC [Allohahella marinimesophila]|uniref:Membrane protein insertase YidC n=1 Tax=Allohahella marinimesophila TaxID=1054972 RepID=A0ABP7PBZ3_9GAMM